MASHISFVISGLLLVIITIVVQSVPIAKTRRIVQTPSINNKQAVKHNILKPADSVNTPSVSTSTTTSASTTVSQNSLPTDAVTDEKNNNNNNKKKRYIDDDDRFDELQDDENDEDGSYQLPYSKFDNTDDKIDHTLHAKIKETSPQIHANADKLISTDDPKVFSDIKMNPNELTDIRRRRDVKFNDESNRRHKRALSPYDFYDTDSSFYDPYADLIEQDQYVRPSRSFAPLYWYPSVYERNIRSALAPSVYESSEWPRIYSDSIDDEEINESPVSAFDDGSEDENDYELNRYPILLHSSNNPYDNLQLQQQYNTDDLPIDEDVEEKLDDDDDEEEPYRLFYPKERPYQVRYGPLETYF